MKFEPEFRYLVAWFNAERANGSYEGFCESIADYVIGGKRYNKRDRIEMISRKASQLYNQGRDKVFTDYSDAMKSLRESVVLHLRAFKWNCIEGSPWADQSERYARTSAYSLFSSLGRSDLPWEIADEIISIMSEKDIYLDPIEDPFVQTLRSTIKTVRRPEVAHRFRQKLRVLLEKLIPSEKWQSRGTSERVKAFLSEQDAILLEVTKSRGVGGASHP